MNAQFRKTPSFLALLQERMEQGANDSVRQRCAAHVGRRTQARIKGAT